MAVMGRGKRVGLVRRHSPEISRRSSAWRRAIRRLCETRGLQGGHLLRGERVEIEGKSRTTCIRHPVGMRGERLREGGGREIRDVLLPFVSDRGGG